MKANGPSNFVRSIIMFLSLQLAVTGFYYTSASLLEQTRELLLYFHLTEIFDTSDNLQKLYFGRFGVFFFSYFLNAVSQPRQIEVSR